MARDPWGRLYAVLLRLYPRSFRNRFEEGMAQTFRDLRRERERAGRPTIVFLLRTFAETFLGAMRERVRAWRLESLPVARPALFVVGVLAVPLLAMQFTEDVAWSPADFLMAGVLLLAAGLGCEFIARRGGGAARRAASLLALVGALLLVWVNLAVGLIGAAGHPANLLYFGLLAAAGVGAVVTRFRSRGLAVTLAMVALAQTMIPLAWFAFWKPTLSFHSLLVTLAGNAFFIVLFAASAWMFRRAAGETRATRG